MLLMELKKQKGTYSAVKFDDNTNDAILNYIKDNKIPNGLSADDLHTTVLYSRKYLPDYKSAGEYDKALEGVPTKFEVWPSSEDGPATNCLVLKYDCTELTKRHNELMDKHKATYDFPTYKPHFTLSYDIGNLDIKKLPDIKKVLPKIIITSEYKEDLNLTWTTDKGTK